MNDIAIQISVRTSRRTPCLGLLFKLTGWRWAERALRRSVTVTAPSRPA